jgi:hypothetical protein
MFARFAEAFNPAVAVSRNVWRRTQPLFRRRAAKFWPSSQRDKLERLHREAKPARPIFRRDAARQVRADAEKSKLP